MTETKPRKRFGDILVEGGLITATQLQQALTYSADRGIKLGLALQNLGFVNDVAVAKTLAKQLKIPFVDLAKIVIDHRLLGTGGPEEQGNPPGPETGGDPGGLC